MIDIPRALSLAWERMIVLLFQPFDSAKWPILGFNAFLMMLGEGDIQFNQPVTFTAQQPAAWTGQSLPALIHSYGQWAEGFRAQVEGPALVWYLFLAVAYIAGWLVLNWVGCRGEFLFIDNIVRNRAAISEPWRRYAREGNVWFVFNVAVTIFTYILVILSLGLLLLVSWSWIIQERSPRGGELVTFTVLLIAFVVFWCVAGAILFIVRSFASLLLFRQTGGLGSALGAVIHLLFSRPLSMLAYVLTSIVLMILGVIVSVTLVCVVCCCIAWISLLPIFGSLLMSALLAQVLLPLFVFYRCFQIECLSQFGPAYDIWSVDVPPAAPSGAASF